MITQSTSLTECGSGSLFSALSLGEALRRLGRRLLPTKLYALGSAALDACLGIPSMGWRNYWDLKHSSHRHLIGQRLVCRIPSLAHPIGVRCGTTDGGTLIQTAVRHAYGKYLPVARVKFIIDAGANIGDTTAFYATQFPLATVVACEPDPENYSLLLENCKPYGDRVIPLKLAIWPRKSGLKLVSAERKTAVSVIEAPSDVRAGVAGISPMDLCSQLGTNSIDIFKCDIEGSETALFEGACDDWLRITRTMYIEAHNARAHRAVFAAAERHNFKHRRYRGLYIFWK